MPNQDMTEQEMREIKEMIEQVTQENKPSDQLAEIETEKADAESNSFEQLKEEIESLKVERDNYYRRKD